MKYASDEFGDSNRRVGMALSAVARRILSRRFTPGRRIDLCVGKLPTIELNGSFYSLQTPSSYAAWHAATPREFLFSVKGSRFITHMKRLKDIDKPLANFFASGLFNLKEKLGPILWQFPPNMNYEAQRFADFIGKLPHDTAAALRLARGRDARMTGRAVLSIDGVRDNIDKLHAPKNARRLLQMLEVQWAPPRTLMSRGSKNRSQPADAGYRWM